jgi:hypothetical protein
MKWAPIFLSAGGQNLINYPGTIIFLHKRNPGEKLETVSKRGKKIQKKQNVFLISCHRDPDIVRTIKKKIFLGGQCIYLSLQHTNNAYSVNFK